MLLDEPTDNLDLVSSEALEVGLQQFNGTVTHDRWFLRNFDRYLVFGDDCNVSDHTTLPPTWADSLDQPTRRAATQMVRSAELIHSRI